MTDEPIFDDIRATWSHVVSHFQHHHNAAPAAQPGRHTAMSALTDVESVFGDFLGRFKAEAEHMASNVLPMVHDGAAKLDQLTSSKIVAEIEALAAPLDPAAEEAIAALIRGAGAAAARIAELTAPPAEPAPADPAADPAAAMA